LKFRVNTDIQDVIFPPIMDIKKLAVGETSKDGLSYIDFSQAIPDYAPAVEMVEYLKGRIPEDSASLYTPDEGLLSVRQAVCRRYDRVYKAAMTPGNVCMTNGASQAFWLAMVTLCNHGDEVIMQNPTYFDYDMALQMQGIKRVYSPFDADRGGMPDAGVIEKLITSRTRAIILVSPCNPTGLVIPPDVIESLYRLAEAHRIALVIDETYADFISGGSMPHELFMKKSWGDHLVHIMSFGKSYAVTGYRAGLLAASEEFIGQALKCQDTMAICQSTPTQIALEYALDHLDPWVAEKRRMMEGRHDCFRQLFEKEVNGFRLVTSGAFFAFLKHPCPGISAWDVSRRLIGEAGLITLPGEIFGPGLSDYLRVAFGNIDESDLIEAVNRFNYFKR
jgi:hypothetical protein